MRPTEILAGEHRVIEQVLNCLEKMTDAAGNGGISWVDADRVVDFLRVFADECHHDKEECHLFPKMEAKGFPREHGPTGVMCAEHEEGRRLIRGMARAIAKAESDPDAATPEFIASARAYLPLLRQHIMKEEHRLFPMANQVFTEADQQQLQSAFDQMETQADHAGLHLRYLRLADELADRYAVPHGQASSLGLVCGCGHALAH